MFLYSLLSVSEQTTELIKWISVVAVILLLAVIAFIGTSNKKEKYDAKKLAFAGICVSMSFTLSVLKFKIFESGGSITFASFVPILLFAYIYGAADGFLVGLIHGLLNFIESPYILTPVTFLLDYLLPFASVGVMGFFSDKKRSEKHVKPLIVGAVCVFSLRLIFHLLSGVIFFNAGYIADNFPVWAIENSFLYSFIYQCMYVPFDALIAIGVLIALEKTKLLDNLLTQIRK